jgi:murein DD-endopeptidase MepM/ murein hydrolase activator NlpD
MQSIDNQHVVRRGDTLEKIAAQNGTTSQALARYNHIKDPNRITIGQIVRFEPKISVQVVDRLHQPIPEMKLALYASGRHLSDAVTCSEGWIRDVVLPSFSDALQVFVFKPTGERKRIASIRPSGSPKSVQLVSPKVKVAAVSANMQGGTPKATPKSKATKVVSSINKAGAPLVIVSTPIASGKEKSGLSWVNRFPTSHSLDDLKEPFKTAAKEFVAALRSAGVKVQINATYRPTERSYLMHYCAEISRGKIDPVVVPPWPGVLIDWAHLDSHGVPDKRAAKAAAQAMKSAYAIGSNPVGKPGYSNHNKKMAIDVSLSEYVGKRVLNGGGEEVKLMTWRDVEKLGDTFGVYWYGVRDRPHWSWNGR